MNRNNRWIKLLGLSAIASFVYGGVVRDGQTMQYSVLLFAICGVWLDVRRESP